MAEVAVVVGEVVEVEVTGRLVDPNLFQFRRVRSSLTQGNVLNARHLTISLAVIVSHVLVAAISVTLAPTHVSPANADLP